jgi:3-dehydroquinate dehydratase/shikimate dehydrogenase
VPTHRCPIAAGGRSRSKPHSKEDHDHVLEDHDGNAPFGWLAVEGRILAAAPHYDLLELEAETDLAPELLSAIPPRKRLISWSGPACDSAQLRHTFDQLSAVPAHSYCLTVTAEKTSHGLQTLLFLKALGRNDVTAFCKGPFGLWSRLLAPSFGAPFLFGHTGLETSLSGEPAINKLVADYGFPALFPVRELYGMVGNRIFQSPSPRLHNAGYRALSYPALFVPFHVERFEDFWREMIVAPELVSLGLPIQGLTIVSPHKEAALAAAVVAEIRHRSDGKSVLGNYGCGK